MKKQIKKLNLNKRTISNLSAAEMNRQVGAGPITRSCAGTCQGPTCGACGGSRRPDTCNSCGGSQCTVDCG